VTRELPIVGGAQFSTIAGGSLLHRELEDAQCRGDKGPTHSYSSPSIIRIVKENEMGRACSSNGEKRNAYRILVGKKRKEITRKTKS
jgi:hypothetical protein